MKLTAVDTVAYETPLLDEAKGLLDYDTQAPLLAIEGSHLVPPRDGGGIAQVRVVERENARCRGVDVQIASEDAVEQPRVVRQQKVVWMLLDLGEQIGATVVLVPLDASGHMQRFPPQIREEEMRLAMPLIRGVVELLLGIDPGALAKVFCSVKKYIAIDREAN